MSEIAVETGTTAEESHDGAVWHPPLGFAAAEPLLEREGTLGRMRVREGTMR